MIDELFSDAWTASRIAFLRLSGLDKALLAVDRAVVAKPDALEFVAFELLRVFEAKPALLAQPPQKPWLGQELTLTLCSPCERSCAIL